MTTHAPAGANPPTGEPESAYAWWRLVAALTLCTIGSVGMWSCVVALPAIQKDFGILRADASLPFMLTMIGFGVGGILMGRLADRHRILVPVIVGAVTISLGYLLSSLATSLWPFALAQGLIGLGSSATFGPLMADISHWFDRRRGIAVAIASSGNYLAGVIYPPIIQYVIEAHGWRMAAKAIGACW